MVSFEVQEDVSTLIKNYERIGATAGRDVSGIPVVDKGKKLVGIITVTDLFQLLNNILLDKDNTSVYSSDRTVLVKDIMTYQMISIQEDTALEKVVEIMSILCLFLKMM